ncbi:MAG: hypothetical protein KA399_00250 [Chitinophagaceae bacterium]|nr:hypothetical protein [Chitinophagaceae bacterium]
MRKLNFFSVLVATVFGMLFSQQASAQLVNDGATITVQPGAIIFCQGNFENKNSGSISNNGKIEVQGNFLNTASYTTTSADDSLILSGPGDKTFNGGASTYTNLWINKATAADRITLTATAFLSGKLDYDQGVFTTDPIANPSFVFSAPTTAVFDFAAGKEIIGNVRRTGWANGSAVVFNQPNMQLTTNTGTAPTDITVTMIPLTESGDPTDNEREVKRKFQFAQTGGTGFTADVRFPYVSGELNTNTEANLVPWGRFTGVWNGILTPVTRDEPNDWVSTTGITQADFVNEWKLADPVYNMNIQAIIRGAWNGASMNTTLNTVNATPIALPNSQPYNDPAFGNYNGGETVAAGFFAANPNIVDWVLIDFRKPVSGLPADANAASALARKAAFLLNNGTIVELDGVTPVKLTLNKQGAGFATIRHRNHLGVMSPSTALDAAGNFTNDFRVLANNYTNGSITSPPAQLLSGGSYGLWAGNANKDGNVNAGDVALVKSQANASTEGYVYGDVNMDKFVNAGDVGLTKVSANNTAQSGSTRTNNNVKPKTIIEPKSHLPEN